MLLRPSVKSHWLTISKEFVHNIDLCMYVCTYVRTDAEPPKSQDNGIELRFGEPGLESDSQ